MLFKKPYKTNRRHQEPFFKRAKRLALRSAKAVLIVSIAPVTALCGWGIYRELTTSEYLSIRTITVTGVRRIAKEDAMEAAGIYEGQNLLALKVGAAEENLRRNPWVRDASISRRLPDGVSITVREREPVAIVKMDDLYVMDSRGVIFKRLSREDDLDLPVVTGLTADVMGGQDGLEAGLMELLQVLASRSGFNREAVSEIHIDPVYGFSLYTLKDGVRLHLGTGQFAQKLSNLDRVVQARGGTLNGVEAMDLTNDHEAIVRFVAGVAKEGGAI